MGYLDLKALNQRSAEFSHSDALTEDNLRQQLAKGGLWDRFSYIPQRRVLSNRPIPSQTMETGMASSAGTISPVGLGSSYLLTPLSLLFWALDR